MTLALAGVVAACGSGNRAGPASEAGAPSRLYLAGDGELWIVDVATEHVRHLMLPALAAGDPPYRIVRRGRRLVLYGVATYVADPAFRRPLRTLARRSWFFIPSANPHRVWIAFLDPRSPDTVRALRAVREMTADGRVTVPDVHPPRGRWPQRALASGLLFVTGGRNQVFSLWDPATRTVVRRLPGRAIGELGPAYGDVLASCLLPCRALRLTNVRTGARRDVHTPPGYSVDVSPAAFSPSGRWLAVPVRRHGAGERASMRLALVDVARRTARVVPGSRVPPGYTLVAWSADERQVFITGGERFRSRTIVAYRLDSARARVLRVSVGDFYDMAAG